MITAAKSSSNHHSPTTAPSPVPSGPRKNLPSPWAQVVRGGDTDFTAAVGIHESPPSSSSSSSSLATGAAEQAPAASEPAQSSSPKVVPASPPPVHNSNTIAVVDSSDTGDGNAVCSKKPVWNKPSNGVVEVGPVMGAESWPALSKPTKASGKLPAESSSKTAVDGSLSTSMGPRTLHSPQKQGASNIKPNSATNHNVPNRQRPMRRTGGSNIGSGPDQSSYSNPPPPPPPPPFPVYQLPPVSYANMVPSIPDPSRRDHYRNNNWDARPLVGGFVPRMNEQRGSSRRGNFGAHPRGDSSYHNNHGGRRDQDRESYVNPRDAHVPQPRMPPRGLLRHPPPSTAAFGGPQPIAPFPNPIGFPVPLEHFRGMPFFSQNPSPATFFPASEPPLPNMIVKQIDYYFSDLNLVKDEYLRSNMDEQGWVPITLIANFPRVRSLTSNIQLILDSLRTSTVVEVQGDLLRRRNDWMRWLPSAQLRADSSSLAPGRSRYANLEADFQTLSVEETTNDEGPKTFSQSQLPNGSDAAGNNN
ncbi:la-related protein 1C-like isoform X2 [Lotus japonicus]|uniref:la-related protein 1C-like isoform X2 n=1 Tax=Lotus japonicus TaxID=34305 RepID=UPI00258FC98F|nr:la-related protein 1C-like isoform X2 [Lotus japonicus]